MKKTFIALLLLLLHYSGFSQYGHRTHFIDSLSNEQFNDGLITDAITSGGLPVYAAAGSVNFTVPSFITRSRFNTSSFTGSQLNSRCYFLFSGTTELQSRLNSICERGTSGYAMSGCAFSSNTAGDVLLMNVGTTGVAGSVRRIDLGGFDEATCTRPSLNNTTRYYTCGSSIATGANTSQVFLMKHNQDGSTIDWVRKFNLPCSGVNGVAQAVAILDDAASGSVVLVGNVVQTSATGAQCVQPFIAKFSSTGALTWLRFINSTSINNISLQNIRPTNTAQEYVIVGSAISSTLANRRQVLFLRVNTSGAAPTNVLTRLIRSNGPTPNYPVQNQNGFDVVTRVDSLNSVSYYISGGTQLSGGSTDGLLIRLSNTSSPVFLRHYTGSGNENLYAIDRVENTVSGRGIAAFGVFGVGATSASLRNRSWLAKTYFNLVSGCNEVIDSPLSTVPSITYTAFTPTITNTFSTNTIVAQTSSGSQQTVCWATTISAGSNARISDEQSISLSGNSIEGITVFPNPVIGSELTFRLISAQDQITHIQLSDVSGKIYADESLNLQSGENMGTVPVSDLPQGIYIVRFIAADGTSKSIRFVRN